jgi:hypothetical protein
MVYHGLPEMVVFHSKLLVYWISKIVYYPLSILLSTINLIAIYYYYQYLSISNIYELSIAMLFPYRIRMVFNQPFFHEITINYRKITIYQLSPSPFSQAPSALSLFPSRRPRRNSHQILKAPSPEWMCAAGDPGEGDPEIKLV